MSDDFLSRWSRRKREAETLREEPEPEQDAAAGAEVPPEGDDDEILAQLGLKHPDEMEPGDDFAGFLRAAVPQHLKTLALRRLWRSNPTLACLDGLNDYDTDFTGTGVPEGGLKTSYEVGRGLLRRIVDVAEDAPPAEAAVVDVVTDDEEAPGDGATADVRPADAAPTAPLPAEQPAPSPRRRMVFRTSG